MYSLPLWEVPPFVVSLRTASPCCLSVLSPIVNSFTVWFLTTSFFPLWVLSFCEDRFSQGWLLHRDVWHCNVSQCKKFYGVVSCSKSFSPYCLPQRGVPTVVPLWEDYALMSPKRDVAASYRRCCLQQCCLTLGDSYSVLSLAVRRLRLDVS